MKWKDSDHKGVKFAKDSTSSTPYLGKYYVKNGPKRDYTPSPGPEVL